MGTPGVPGGGRERLLPRHSPRWHGEAGRAEGGTALTGSHRVPGAGPPFRCPVFTPLPSFRYGGGRLGLASPPRPPPRPVPPALRRLLLAGPATGCVVFGLLGTAARCQEAAVPVPAVPVTPEPAQPRPEPSFDWPAFWTFLRPQLLALSAAVVVSRGGWADTVPLVPAVPVPRRDAPA